MNPLLTVRQAAEVLNLSERTLYNQVSDGSIKVAYVKLGKAIRFRPEDLEKFIERRTVKPNYK